MARNKKFGKLGVNENYSEDNVEKPELSENEKASESKEKKSFLPLIFKKKTADNTENTEGTPQSEQDSYPELNTALSEKFTYTKKRRVVSKAENQSSHFVPDAPKGPIVLLIAALCLSLFAAFLLNLDFLFSLGYGASSALKAGISVVVYIVPSLIYIMFHKENGEYNLKLCSAKYMPFVLVALGLVLSATALQKYVIAYVFSYRVPMGMAGEASLAVELLVGAAVPAVCEEFLMRGVLQHEFSGYAGGFGGVLFSSLAFTLLHFDLQFFGVYFVAGLILGCVTHVTKSVFPAMIIHFLNNTFSIALSDRLTFVALERIGGTLLIIVLAAFCFVLLTVMLQMMEKISMKRAVYYLSGEKGLDESENNGHYYRKEENILFVAKDGYTLSRTAKLFANKASVICYIVFLAAVIAARFIW